jgi:hypothetical protein
MIVGLDKFAVHFADYKDRYVLIGGAAAWLIMDEAGIEPRATKDLDIVLYVEVLDPAFGAAFWEFIRAGGYASQEKSESDRVFYRFQKPSDPDYPAMLELFSRKPDAMILGDDGHLTPIPVGADVSSLSAILLDEAYYYFLHRHTREIDGVSIVSELCLIPLKARAWLDMTQRKTDGASVDSKDIRKHRNDVLRLYLLLPPGASVELPGTIREDLAVFLREITPELNIQLLKQLGILRVGATEVLQFLRQAYGIVEGGE